MFIMPAIVRMRPQSSFMLQTCMALLTFFMELAASHVPSRLPVQQQIRVPNLVLRGLQSRSGPRVFAAALASFCFLA